MVVHAVYQSAGLSVDHWAVQLVARTADSWADWKVVQKAALKADLLTDQWEPLWADQKAVQLAVLMADHWADLRVGWWVVQWVE